MTNFVGSVLEATKEAIRALNPQNSTIYESLMVGAGGDVSLKADLMCEEILSARLRHFGHIHSEESGLIEGESQDIIYLDPLDGSTNLSSLIPYYGTSVALCDPEGRTKAAAVINFCSGEAFIKTDAFALHGSIWQPIDTFIPIRPLEHASKIGIFEGSHRNAPWVLGLHQKGLKFRSPGAIALSMAYAHNVSFVLFDGEIREYDTKAGLFLCSDLHIYHDERALLISRDPIIFENLLELISQKG